MRSNLCRTLIVEHNLYRILFLEQARWPLSVPKCSQQAQPSREPVSPFLDRQYCLRLYEFSVDGNGNIIAHKNSAGLKRGIPHTSP